MAVVFIPAAHSTNTDTTAKRIACEGLMSTYDAQTASVQQMRDYADCVRTLHPSNISGARGLVAVVLIGIVIGAIIGVIKHEDMHESRFGGALIGGIIGLVCTMVIGLLLVAIGFVLGF